MSLPTGLCFGSLRTYISNKTRLLIYVITKVIRVSTVGRNARMEQQARIVEPTGIGRSRPGGAKIDLAPRVARIERQTLSEQVYQELKDWLITARAIPGERLSLRSLANVIGVSPMPVRDATNRLVAENALEVLPNRSMRVPIMSRTHFIELRMIRVALEGLAAALAAGRRTETDFVAIAADLLIYERESRRTKPDPMVAIRANRNFHFRIYRAAASPALLPMIEGLWLRVGGVMNVALRMDPQRLRTVAAHRHHKHLLQSIKNKDADGAREAVVADITSAGDRILAHGGLPE
jgi:DNA-binding GntR family transcriptional regulator